MPIAIYRKAAVKLSSRKTGHKRSVLAGALIIVGTILLGIVAGPVAGYFIFTKPSLGKVSGAQTASGPVVDTDLDYRNPQNWFPTANFGKVKPSKITAYNLTIEKLGIKSARVEIGGEDLGKSLIQYPGTANPGELGSTVIFGHSVLRQFFNPTNYMTIFSKIMTLEPGDNIVVDYDGVKYTFGVVDKVTVKPADVEILEQRFDGRYLKLITCVPEGTYLARGVVISQLR